MEVCGDGGGGRRRVRTCAMVRVEFSVFSVQFSVVADWRGMAGFNRGATEVAEEHRENGECAGLASNGGS